MLWRLRRSSVSSVPHHQMRPFPPPFCAAAVVMYPARLELTGERPYRTTKSPFHISDFYKMTRVSSSPSQPSDPVPFRASSIVFWNRLSIKRGLTLFLLLTASTGAQFREGSRMARRRPIGGVPKKIQLPNALEDRFRKFWMAVSRAFDRAFDRL